MYLQIQSKNKKFAESVFQGFLKLIKLEKITLSQFLIAFEEVMILSPSLSLSYTP